MIRTVTAIDDKVPLCAVAPASKAAAIPAALAAAERDGFSLTGVGATTCGRVTLAALSKAAAIPAALAAAEPDVF